jgi:hypothetical protein
MQIRGGCYGTGHSIWNVVEFQVEEDFVAESGEAINRTGPFSGVELASNLKKSRRAPHFRRKDESGAQAVVIDRDDYSP